MKMVLIHMIISKLPGRDNSSILKRYIKYVSLVLISFVCINVQANIRSVNVNNSPDTVSISTTSQSQITWSVVEQSFSTGNVTVSSTRGEFRTLDQDILLGRIDIPLIQARPMSQGSIGTFVFSESLIIPLGVIRRAQQMGISQFIYSRSFFDNPDGGVGGNQVVFRITGGSNAGELVVRRIQMEFDDRRVTTIIAPKEKIKAHAIITYNGTGLIEYTWEVASPPSTLGQAIFTPMMSRKQYLLAGNQVTLQSPNLPSVRKGNYLVRLRLDKPNPGFTMPVIRYLVNSKSLGNNGLKVQPIKVILPAENILLVKQTEFVWNPIEGAKAYQLEIYDRPIRDNHLPGTEARSPIAGILIPATNNKLKVNKLSRTHLQHGNIYYWRVVALSENGQIVGLSDYRSIEY